jgi:hypothetical protein
MWFVNCMEHAGGRLSFAFRPLNGKQNKKVSLRTLRLCGEKNRPCAKYQLP